MAAGTAIGVGELRAGREEEGAEEGVGWAGQMELGQVSGAR